MGIVKKIEHTDRSAAFGDRFGDRFDVKRPHQNFCQHTKEFRTTSLVTEVQLLNKCSLNFGSECGSPRARREALCVFALAANKLLPRQQIMSRAFENNAIARRRGKRRISAVKWFD